VSGAKQSQQQSLTAQHTQCRDYSATENNIKQPWTSPAVVLAVHTENSCG